MASMPKLMLTGAGSGIGRAVASRMIRSGYRVFGSAIDTAEATALANELGPRFVPVVADVRDEQSVHAASAAVKAVLGGERLHALLNCAGIICNGALVDLSAATFSNILSVNLVGTHRVSQAFLPLLANGAAGSPRGRIINMSSASGRRTMPFTGAYSASKFGVEALSAAMRMEYAPLGVDVVVFAPGLIHTPMAERILDELARAPSLPIYEEPLRRFAQRTRASIEAGIPLQRVVETIRQVIEVGKPRMRYELHNHFLRDVLLMRLLPTRLREALVARSFALVAAQ